MSIDEISSLNRKLLKPTSFLGIRLWVLVVALILLFTALLLLVCMVYLCRQKSKPTKYPMRLPNPISCTNYRGTAAAYSGGSSSMDRMLLSRRISKIEMNIAKLDRHHQGLSHVHRQWPNLDSGMTSTPVSGGYVAADLESVGRYSPVGMDLLWRGNRYALKDIEVITNGFDDRNVIGKGEHGVVYRGVLLDTTRVAVKRIFLTSGCTPEDFVTQVDVIGHVRHKNLVKLLGYCMEGGYRMILNEFVDNGNLHQWLHGCPDQVSPLTWSLRMNIIQGIAKGLAYLHEDFEPKIVHQGLKSSNILLDHQWNPKISDYGILKLLGPEQNHQTAVLMGQHGYLSKESASTGVLNEKTDVYSFGILVMEIICGRTPVDQNQPQVYLFDWLKSMVASQKIMYVVDPKLPEMPSSKELKRVLLLALRCVDDDIKHRPTMGDVIHMLEPRNLLLLNDNDQEHHTRRDASSRRSCSQKGEAVGTKSKTTEAGFTQQERESRNNLHQTIMPGQLLEKF